MFRRSRRRLPVRQAAPIEYVRICDAYGAGFFYIPGTETCLRVGGLALAELRGFDPPSALSARSFTAMAPGISALDSSHPLANIPMPARAMRLTSPPWAGSNSTPGPSRPGAPCGRSFASMLSSGRMAAPLSAVLGKSKYV